MAQMHSGSTPRYSRSVRRRSRAGPRLALIAFVGAVAFAAGFMLLWSFGSWLVGGRGFPWGSDDTEAAAVVAVPAESDYTIEPLVDLLAFRDLSYIPVKGIYVTSDSAATPAKLKELIALADSTEINAFVIDVKDDQGWVTYAADVPMAKELKLYKARIPDIDALVATLSEHHIIPIARIVCFADNVLTKKRPELAVQSTKGGVWTANAGYRWLNPYSHEVWEYLVEVAEDAARHGFREIQFDYVRFSTGAPISQALYPGEYSTKEDAITGFLAFARQRLEKMGVWVSADVFGVVMHDTAGARADAANIGQKIEKICANIDLICPMIYPSHYTTGWYGLDDPNSEPYELVTGAMKDTTQRLAGTGAKGRPWLQDYSLYGVKYGVSQVKAQIRAAEEQGFDEWMLWNANNRYTVGALRAEGG
jgi:hypothetical protein